MSKLATQITISADDRASSIFKKVAGNAESLCSRIENLGSKVNNIFSVLTLGAGGLAGGSIIKNSLLDAAKYETVGRAMEHTATIAGYSTEQINQFDRSLQRRGISMQESRQNLIDMATAELDLTKATQAARAAQDLAASSGKNSSETFESLIRGVTGGQVEVLRTIGLMVNFESAYANYAKANHKRTQDLSEAEKMQVRFNAALEAANNYAGSYELTLDTAGKQLGTFTRLYSDMLTMGGEFGLEALSHSIFGVNSSIESVNAELREMKDSGEMQEYSELIGSAFRTIISSIDDVGVALLAYTVLSKASNTVFVQRFNNLRQEHGAYKTLGGIVKGNTATLGQDTAALIANTEAKIANHKASLAEIDRSIVRKKGIIAESSLPVHSADLEAIKTRKLLQKDVKILEGEQIFLTRQLTKEQLALESATKKSSVALRAFGGLKSGVAGLLNLFGGPWMLGLTALATGIYAFANRQTEAEKIAKSYGLSLEDLNTKFASLTEGIKDAAQEQENLTERQRNTQLKRLEQQEEASKKQFENEIARFEKLISLKIMVFDKSGLRKIELFSDIDPAYKAQFDEIIASFKTQKITAADAAKELEVLQAELRKTADSAGMFDLAGRAAGGFADHIDGVSASIKAMLVNESALQGFLNKLAGLRTASLPPDIGAENAVAWAKLREKAHAETAKAFSNTKAGKIEEAQARITAAISHHNLLNTQKTAAVVTQAQEDLNRLLKDGTKGGANKTASAFDSLKSKVEALRAKLTEDAGDGFLAKTNKELADAERAMAGMKGLQKSEYAAMMQEYKQLASDMAKKEDDKKLQQTMQVRLDFEREYADMVGVTSDAVAKSLQKQYEDYKKAGIDIVALEEWKADKIRRASRDAMDGAYAYLRDFTIESTNMAKNTSTALAGIFDGMGNAFSVTTDGMKFEWQSMLNQMLNQAFKALAINPILGGLSSGLSSLIGGMNGSSLYSGGYTEGMSYGDGMGLFAGMHGGGKVGVDATFLRAAPLALFADAKRYHTGGPILKQDEVPIIAKVGERMLNEKQNELWELLTNGNIGQPVDITVVLKNESGQPLEAKNTNTQWSGDMRSAVISIVLDAVNRNFMGARDALGK